MNGAIIVAAGAGKRMGPGENKIFRVIGKSTVIYSAVKSFTKTGLIDKIVVVTSKPNHEKIIASLKELYSTELVSFAEGGESRQKSVLNGLRVLEKKLSKAAMNIVLIHDAARPWVSKKIIEEVVRNASVHGACAPVIPSSDAIKTIDARGTISAHLPRESTLAVQTPQGFLFDRIYTAHAHAAEDGFPYIDDTEIYDKYVGPVFTIEGEPENRKITYPHDLAAYDGE